MDFFRVTGDTDDSFTPSIDFNRHIDPSTDARIVAVRIYSDDILFSVQDLPGGLMIGADAVRIPAGNDDAFSVHDIYIVISIFRDLFDQFFSKGYFEHSVLH